MNGRETFTIKVVETVVALREHVNKTVFAVLQALKALVALDTAGRLLGWKVFDHAARLGGAAFRM